VVAADKVLATLASSAHRQGPSVSAYIVML